MQNKPEISTNGSTSICGNGAGMTLSSLMNLTSVNRYASSRFVGQWELSAFSAARSLSLAKAWVPWLVGWSMAKESSSFSARSRRKRSGPRLEVREREASAWSRSEADSVKEAVTAIGLFPALPHKSSQKIDRPLKVKLPNLKSQV